MGGPGAPSEFWAALREIEGWIIVVHPSHNTAPPALWVTGMILRPPMRDSSATLQFHVRRHYRPFSPLLMWFTSPFTGPLYTTIIQKTPALWAKG